MELVVVTRRDCGLCEEMEAVVARVVAGGGPGGWAVARTVDVDSDPELVERFGEEVPVLLIDGRKAFKYRVDESSLRKRLRADRRRSLLRRWRSLLRG